MIITRTPLRISFTGGGTDVGEYYEVAGGAVVSAAIDKYIYITVNKKFDNSIRISYSNTEIVPEVEDIHHDLVREAMLMVGVKGGIEITSIADIPSGTGLGSSSAFTVGVLNALYSYKGKQLSWQELAEQACEIEINILKHPIGKQDQYAVAYGGLNFFMFHPDGRVECEKIKLDEKDIRAMRRKLLLFYTGITRSADAVLIEQKNNTNAKRDILDFMKNQAYIMREELKSQGFTQDFGLALHEGWKRKQTLASTITSASINDLYGKAMDAGASGGKLLGAGGGGFLLFYCDEEKQEKVCREIGLKLVDFSIDKHGSRVIYFA